MWIFLDETSLRAIVAAPPSPRLIDIIFPNRLGIAE